MKSNYTMKYCFVALIAMSCLPCLGQWSHDFSTNDLSDWSEDIGDFIVNGDNQLQLNAAEAGNAFIYRSSIIDFDTLSINIYHMLDFAPSNNNRSRIYLAMDDQNPLDTKGYFIEIGENGSDDGLKFYYIDNGTEELIASGSMGALSMEPAIVRLSIDIFPNGLWSVKTNYEGGDFLGLEMEFMNDQFSFKESQFFGLACKFSASRADKFFFDDLSIQPFERDTSPPEVTNAFPVNSTVLDVIFSEPVLEFDASNASNYIVNNSLGNPISIVKVGTLGNQYQLEFNEAFDASKDYLLSVSGISDLNDNEMVDQSLAFLYAGEPEIGDLFLSEILFDPYIEGEDFIEIYNSSNKNIDLMGITIRNDQKDESQSIVNSVIVPAGSYVALSKDVDFLFQEYKPEQGAIIEFQNLPAFNNDEGNVMLINSSGMVLDSFNYNESQHFQLIDDTEGVSLERVSFEVEANDDRNWQSAAKNVRFATPGYKNSNAVSSITGEENFEILTESFSPNQDGDDDQMILTYNLEKPGYLANINVHDAAGFKIKELSNNELLGVQGIITWDGTDMDNQISDIGIYIILGNIFHSDGEKLNFKLITVLADFID